MSTMYKSRFNPAKHHRRSIRLKGYDYASEGAYFVTIVTQARECLFGEIFDGEIHLTKCGEIVQKWWDEIPIHFPNVGTGAFIIMPNHIHGVIFITDQCRGEVVSPRNDSNNLSINQEIIGIPGAETAPPHKPTLGQIIAYFKFQSTKEINNVDNTGIITKLWQRNYYEHIIRNEKELKQKTDYILGNPSRWEDDRENPKYKKSPSA